MGKTYTVDANAYDEMARTTVEMLRVHADLKCKYYEMMTRLSELEAALISANERAAFAESREVCTMPHDGDVTTCGYCQRDALLNAQRESFICSQKKDKSCPRIHDDPDNTGMCIDCGEILDPSIKP